MNAFVNDYIAVTGLASYFPSNSKTFKQLQVEMLLEVPPEKQDIEHILHDIINIKINDTFILETPCSKSHEGQILTGRKLIINGEILQKIEYVAYNCTQSVHAAEFVNKFYTYIVLDDSSCHSPTYNITAYIENVFIEQLDKRFIFNNVTFILDAIPTNTELLGSPCFEPITEGKKDINLDKQYDCSCIARPARFFSQFNCIETVVLPSQKPDIEQVASIIVDPEIISVKFINTMKGVSIEGQCLTGKKAIIEIKFKQKILYAADCPDHSIYGDESVFFKSAYIVIPPLIEGTDPEHLYKNNMLKVKLTIEDTYFTKRGKRSVFESICMLAELELKPTYEICYSTYHSCEKSDLFLCFEDGSCNTQITKTRHYKNIKPCWSPNGSQLAYLSGTQDGYTLFSFNIKNNSHQALVPHETFENISSFSWLKDSQKIVFSAIKAGNKELYLLNTATNSYQHITQGSGLIKSYYPKVSPDGSDIAYLRSSTYRVDLWHCDACGKNARKITDTGTVRDFDWLADGKGLVYIDNRNEELFEIYMITLDEYFPSCVVSCNSLYGARAIAVSSDGCYIAFIGTNKDSDDIYIYDTLKNETINITNHQNSIKINSIAWKIDSRKIYYAAKEFMHYDVCCVDISTQYKERLTNTDSSYMQIAYRPRIK